MSEKAALYARVSTDNQDITPQVEQLEKWAEYEEYDYDTYADEGVSAIAEHRPAFDHMMGRIDEYDLVAFTALDRFGRSVDQLSTWAADLKRKDVDLVILDHNLDTTTKEGELLFHILMVIAEYERKVIRERMQAGFERAQEEGRVGRPKIEIDEAKLQRMRDDGAGAQYLANYFGVSRATIYNRLDELKTSG